MSTYDIIKKIMESNRINESDKVHYIEMFLKGWHTVDEIRWIWE